MKKLKFLIFNTGHFIYGSERGLINLVKVLNEKAELVIVLPSRKYLRRELKRLFPKIKIMIFPLVPLMFSLSPLYYFRWLSFSCLGLLYFSLYAKDEEIDVIVTNNSLLLFPAIVAKFVRIKHIWWIREYFPLAFINRILKVVIEALSDIIICQSRTIKEKFNFSKRSAVIYEAFSEANYNTEERTLLKEKLNLNQTEKIIAVISRIHPSKGQYEFLKKIKEELLRQKGYKVLLVGDITPLNLRNWWYKKRIVSLIKQHELSNVILLGYQEDVKSIIEIADICVFPFLREEPFGITVVEALLWGKVVIYPFQGGLKEIYQMFKRGLDYKTIDIKDTLLRVSPISSEEQSLSVNVPQEITLNYYRERLINCLKRYDIL